MTEQTKLHGNEIKIDGGSNLRFQNDAGYDKFVRNNKKSSRKQSYSARILLNYADTGRNTEQFCSISKKDPVLSSLQTDISPE
jgi:hypothetical protein